MSDEKKPASITPAPTRASGQAIASLILGLISIVCCSLLPISALCAIGGLILGIYSLRKCKPSTKTDIAGIVTSSVGLAMFALIIGSAIYIFGNYENYSRIAPHTLQIVADIENIVTDYDRDGTLPEFLEEDREVWEDIWKRCGSSLVESYGIEEETTSQAEDTETTE